jgi:hypothetical protein
MTDFSFSLKEKLGGDLVGFNSRRLHHILLGIWKILLDFQTVSRQNLPMSKPKFPMVIKRGHAVAKIYKTPSRGCDLFTVVHHLGDKRQRR